MEKFWLYTVVGLGSALGGVGRFWLSGVVAARLGQTFPWGTLLVNVTGSFVIGLLGAFAGTDDRPGNAWLMSFLMAGVCGGYTTFSAFSLQTLALLREGRWLLAGANVAASVLLCLLGVWLGHLAGQALSR
jgi:CrcB protein